MIIALKKSGLVGLALFLMCAVFTSCEEDKTVSATYMVVADSFSPADDVSRSIVEAIVAYQREKGLLDKAFKESMDGDKVTDELDQKAATNAAKRLRNCDFAKIVKNAGITVPADQRDITINYWIGYVAVNGGLANEHKIILPIEASVLR